MVACEAPMSASKQIAAVKRQTTRGSQAAIEHNKKTRPSSGRQAADMVNADVEVTCTSGLKDHLKEVSLMMHIMPIGTKHKVAATQFYV